MKDTCKNAYERFTNTVSANTKEYAENLDYDMVIKAAELIDSAVSSGGRIHISGIGKCAYVAGYIASLLSSTGTPAYVLHGTEAVHGSCGQLMKDDVVIFVSNSGETQEMKTSVRAIKNNGCRVIGVSGSDESWLAKESDIHLLARVSEEGGPLNRAPRMSFLVQIIVLQALSVVLQEERGITPEQYVRWHPGGKLGEIRDSEK